MLVGRMRRFFRRFFGVVLGLVVAIALAVRVLYGGKGEAYEDLTGPPLLAETALELVASTSQPPGNLAVAPDGRLFFTIHPESRPDSLKLVEWVDGKAVPYPDLERQSLFDTPLGVRIDRQNRIWVLDHAHHGIGQPRLFAFDLATGETVHDLVIDRDAAPIGSFLNDLAIDPAGETIYIADVSFLRKSPAIVVLDVASGGTRRILEKHRSVKAQDWLIETPERPMAWLGGLLTLEAGVDGIALSRDGEWLFYAAMNHSHAFRLRVADVKSDVLNAPGLAANAEAFGRKPLSDGLTTDLNGNLLITDVEHGAVHRLSPSGQLETLIRSTRIRWADGLSYGPDGWLYLTDSAIPDQMLRSKAHIVFSAPYSIYRFRPGIDGIPGH
ncbi:MAG: SMP-30/gluconolactonase/LRE family protein [Longimicrobiales bacterium]